MGKQTNRKLIAYLPLVIGATFVVVVAPLLLVFWLRKSGVVTSAWVGMAAGVVISFLTSTAGAAFWKTRTDSRDILFSELMLWGWLHRWRSERQLNAARDLLGLTSGRPEAISGGHLTTDQKTGLLTQLSSGLEARDPYTHGHSRRVARHAANIAKRMGLPRAEVAKIRAAGAMHDVGKVETPAAILNKEGKLTDEEYEIVKRHPVDGAKMVEILGDDELTAIVRHHHERLDGTGYPDRLVGETIPIGARIISVADTFDAITSTRPYRNARAHKKALDILVAEAGTQLDPAAVRAFCSCYSGRRPLAYWTILANARPRIASWLGGGLGTAKAAAANVMATAGTAAALGSAALGPVVGLPSDSPQALASDATSPASSTPWAGTRANGWGVSPRSLMDGRRSRREHDSTPRRRTTTVPNVVSPGRNSAPDPGAPPIETAQRPPDATPVPDPGSHDSQGNGDGNGNGEGHGNGGQDEAPGPVKPTPLSSPDDTNQDPGSPPSTPIPTPVSVPAPAAPAPAPTEGPGNGNGQGNGNGNANGNGNGQGNGNGNANGQGNGNANGQGNGNANGQGNGNANGQGNGQGQGNGNGQGSGNGPGLGQGQGNGQGFGQGQGNGQGQGQGNGNN